MRLLFTISFSLILFFSKSQEKPFIQNLNTWFIISNKLPLTNNWSLTTTVHIRRSNFIKDSQQQMYRLGFKYQLPKKYALFIGIDHLTTNPYGNDSSKNIIQTNRSWQMISWKYELNKFTLKQHLKIEQLFSHLNKSQTYKYENSFRYLLGISIPFSSHLSISSSNEIFTNFNSFQEVYRLNQNRCAITLEVSGKHSRFKIGYMNQFIIKSSVALMNHTMLIGFNYQFDWKP